MNEWMITLKATVISMFLRPCCFLLVIYVDHTISSLNNEWSLHVIILITISLSCILFLTQPIFTIYSEGQKTPHFVNLQTSPLKFCYTDYNLGTDSVDA